MRRAAGTAAFALALCSLVFAQQALTVGQLYQFIHSVTTDSSGRQSDRDIAAYLLHVRLSERLDNATLERMQAEGVGASTLTVLRLLRDRSANLPAAAPIVVAERPVDLPPPSASEQAAILEAVRRYALEYSGKLPDFVCREAVITYGAPVEPSASWVRVSNIDSRLTYFQQKEDYRPYMKDGKFTTQEYDKLRVSRSVGDFGSMLRGIFEPASETRFEWRNWSTWDGAPAMDFSYRVSPERSHYQVTYEDSPGIVSGYSGYVVVDPKSHVVHKLTLVADALPADFPVWSVSSTLMYREQDLSGHIFLLPSEFEAVMSGPGGRNKIEKRFTVYRKYSADSEITFGGDPVKK